MAPQQKSPRKIIHIKDILDEALKSFRQEPDTELLEVWKLWEGIVGQVIAENTKPAAFKGKLLIVHASSSTWIQQLQFFKKDIISKINIALGGKHVDDIRFKIGRI
ncbi:MAG: DUF721 domain-containing protein [Desulfobacterales bacterium]|nr:DUF721 domain-containing protein [Desulfobacterales bacterium]